MKAVDVKQSTYTDFNKENNKEGCKFKVGEQLLEYRNIKRFLKKALLQTVPEKIL